MNSKAKAILTKYDDAIATLGLELREFLLSHLKGCLEMPDIPANIIGYGYGTGYIDLICTIIPSKKGIKLGFNRGSELPDPESILTGRGKVHRYVEINSMSDIKKRAVKQLLKEAIKAWKKRKEVKALK